MNRRLLVDGGVRLRAYFRRMGEGISVVLVVMALMTGYETVTLESR
jgi:hypothetical protein